MPKLLQLFTLSSLILGSVAISSNYSAASASFVSNVFEASLPKLKQQTSTLDNKNVIETSDFKFDLQNCHKPRPKTVTCQILITKISPEDAQVSLYNKDFAKSSSRIFDSSGNESLANSVQIGQSQGNLASTRLVTGIAVKALITFELLENVSQLELLEVQYVTGNRYATNNASKIEFRQVDITESASNTTTSKPTRNRKK